jgi:hypothetical protein
VFETLKETRRIDEHQTWTVAPEKKATCAPRRGNRFDIDLSPDSQSRSQYSKEPAASGAWMLYLARDSRTSSPGSALVDNGRAIRLPEAWERPASGARHLRESPPSVEEARVGSGAWPRAITVAWVRRARIRLSGKGWMRVSRVSAFGELTVVGLRPTRHGIIFPTTGCSSATDSISADARR